MSDYGLQLRQYMNDSIWSKNKLGLKLPRFFTRLFGEWKSAANSNLIYSSTKWCLSYIVFTLAKICLSNKSFVISLILYRLYFWNMCDPVVSQNWSYLLHLAQVFEECWEGAPLTTLKDTPYIGVLQCSNQSHGSFLSYLSFKNDHIAGLSR